MRKKTEETRCKCVMECALPLKAQLQSDETQQMVRRISPVSHCIDNLTRWMEWNDGIRNGCVRRRRRNNDAHGGAVDGAYHNESELTWRTVLRLRPAQICIVFVVRAFVTRMANECWQTVNDMDGCGTRKKYVKIYAQWKSEKCLWIERGITGFCERKRRNWNRRFRLRHNDFNRRSFAIKSSQFEFEFAVTMPFGRRSPLETLALPGVILAYKYSQFRQRRREAASRRVTERELSALHHKIVRKIGLHFMINSNSKYLGIWMVVVENWDLITRTHRP